MLVVLVLFVSTFMWYFGDFGDDGMSHVCWKCNYFHMTEYTLHSSIDGLVITYRNVQEWGGGKLVKSRLKSLITHFKSRLEPNQPLLPWSFLEGPISERDPGDPKRSQQWPSWSSMVRRRSRSVGGSSRAFFHWCHGPRRCQHQHAAYHPNTQDCQLLATQANPGTLTSENRACRAVMIEIGQNFLPNWFVTLGVRQLLFQVDW